MMEMVNRQKAGQVRRSEKPEISLPEPLKRYTEDEYRPRGALYWGVSQEGWMPPPMMRKVDAEKIPAAIALISQSLAPASHEAITRILTDLAMTTHIDDAEKEVWKHRMRIFIDEIGHMPEDIIEEAAVEYRREERFYPLAVSDFLRYARPIYESRLRTKRRLEVLANVAKNPVPDGRTITQEWLDKVLEIKARSSADTKGLMHISSFLDEGKDGENG